MASPGVFNLCILQPQPKPMALFTYYAILSLIVVVLVLSLLSFPFLQLLTEVNVIISRLLLYLNKELLGDVDTSVIKQLGDFLNSHCGLVMVTFFSLAYLLYVGSTDFLLFAGCYIYNLPDVKYLEGVKKFTLLIIEFLLKLTGYKEYSYDNEEWNVESKFSIQQPENPES
ncbi:hypothetical protein RUM43_014893 [Polyplax serrata]|uniref:Uncharacterized protein n=1 Tax=Polyplax serrata TaxID=468196 RepID=A0AAN8NYS4_POLSC